LPNSCAEEIDHNVALPERHCAPLPSAKAALRPHSSKPLPTKASSAFPRSPTAPHDRTLFTIQTVTRYFGAETNYAVPGIEAS
jgi:hypothetical protein